MAESDRSRPGAAGGSLRRVGTADPNRFLIPASEVPPGFATNLDASGEGPAAPRPAATVVVARDTARGPEVLLLKRHGASGFAAGAWVFPGGLVDAADRDARILERASGPGPAEWAARMRMSDPQSAIAHVVAAIREAWEEAGLLLAAAPTGPDPHAALDALRDDLLAGRTSFPEIVSEQGLELRGDALVYLAHWITPESEPRRYDTRFFLASAEAATAAPPDAGAVRFQPAELTEARWSAPAAAVRGFEAGELRMLPPTVHTLRRLLDFDTVDEMMAASARADVPTILPRMARTEAGIVIEVSSASPEDGR